MKVELVKKQEALYRTMHNSMPGYRNHNWGINTFREWKRFLNAPPASVLEIGCGNGKLCKHLASLGYDVTGVDLVPGPYDRSQYKFILYDLMSLKPMPLTDCEMDYCVSFDVLEHLPVEYVEAAIREMWRVCKELIVAVPTGGGPPLHLTVRTIGWWVDMFNKVCDTAELKTVYIYSSTDRVWQRLMFHAKQEERKEQCVS